jgi:hypothetical protein
MRICVSVGSSAGPRFPAVAAAKGAVRRGAITVTFEISRRRATMTKTLGRAIPGHDREAWSDSRRRVCVQTRFLSVQLDWSIRSTMTTMRIGDRVTARRPRALLAFAMVRAIGVCGLCRCVASAIAD